MRWYDLPNDGAHERQVSGDAGEGGVRCKTAVGVESRTMICPSNTLGHHTTF